MLKIEDVANQCGLTKRTIRYYEELGIIPAPHRSEKGTRLYTQEHVELLKKMINTKEVLGFSLQELQRFIAMKDVLEHHRHGYRQLTDQRERISKLKEMESTVNEQLELLDQKMKKIELARIDLEDFKKRVQNGIAVLEEEVQS